MIAASARPARPTGDSRAGAATPASPAIPEAELRRRMEGLRRAMRRANLDAFLVFDRTDTHYLSGFRGSLSYLLVTADSARLLVDGRYIEAAGKAAPLCEVVLFKKLEKSLKAWRKEFAPRRVGFEGTISVDAMREFERHLPGVELVESGGSIRALRLVKSAWEIERLAASARMNDAVYEAAIEAARTAPDELAVRDVIRREADRRGAEGLSFECIVAAGASGSMPHYVPGPVPLREGTLLLIDQGVTAPGGYCSDMTRVVALGDRVPARLRKAFDATLEAEKAALAEVGPGVACKDLHRIAVETLKKRGLANRFTHGLGHGVGLEIHEAPRLNKESETILKPGMIVTIEPGVYLPGLGGVRIEDLVVVTKDGGRALSAAPKEWRVVERG